MASSSGSKVKEVQQQVDDVKAVMQENVEVMLANIDKTEVLENKSAALADQAKTFHKSAKDTRRQMCKQNAKMNLIIAGGCVVLLLIIIIPIISATGAASGGGGGGDDDDDSSEASPPPPPAAPATTTRVLRRALQGF